MSQDFPSRDNRQDNFTQDEDFKPNLQKMDFEIDKSHPTEKAEDTSPISYPEGSDETQRKEWENKIISDLVGRFEKWDAWRKNYEKVWDQIYRLLFSVQDKVKTPTRSQIAIPMAFRLIETALPKIVNTIFSGDNFFEVLPVDPKSQMEAEKIELLLTYQLSQAQFYVKFLEFTKQLLMYGTSYFYVTWTVKRKWTWSRIPKRGMHSILGFMLGQKVEWEEKKEYRVTERRPDVSVLDILDVFPDPEARDEKDARGVFIRSWCDLEDIQEMGRGKYPVYANTENTNLQGKTYTFAASRQMRYSARGVSNTTGVGTTKQVELLIWWGRYDVDGDGIKEEAYIVIANRNTLLACKGNPFHHQKRPIIRCVLFPVVNEWYGLGLIEPVITNILEMNVLRRQRLDNINMVINRMWKVNSFADIDLDTLISSPNNIIVTDDMNGLEALTTPDVTQSAYAEVASIQAEIEETMVPRSVQGTPESGKLGRTARGAALIVGQAMEKFGTAVRLVEEMAIKRVVRMFHQLNLQFIDDDDVLTDPGMYGHLFDNGIRVEDLRVDVNFKMVSVSEMIGKEAKINQAVSFMGVFGKVLSPDSISTIAKKVWKLMNFDQDEIELQGAPPPQNPGEIVDQNLSSAISGQAQNQGTQAGPPTMPGVQGV